MIEENLDFLQKMIKQKRDLYSIVSFLSESLDTMRTHLQDDGEYQGKNSEQIYARLKTIVKEIQYLDKLL